MKTRFASFFLAAVLAAWAMTGCRAARSAAAAQTTVTAGTGDHALTMEEAESIALIHAGFSADQASALHTQYEIEHGIPQYDVEFHIGAWEYEYEIHADTGEILSYTKDD